MEPDNPDVDESSTPSPFTARDLPPLKITGVVLTKQQILETFRVYLPTVVDFTASPDGERFTILFDPNEKAQVRDPERSS